MNNFKSFNIKPQVLNFTGEKIKIERILNTEIEIHDFKIEPSKLKKGTDYLTLQIMRSGIYNVVFTGSTILIQMINKIPKEKFPFKTTIKKDNEYYEFT